MGYALSSIFLKKVGWGLVLFLSLFGFWGGKSLSPCHRLASSGGVQSSPVPGVARGWDPGQEHLVRGLGLNGSRAKGLRCRSGAPERSE